MAIWQVVDISTGKGLSSLRKVVNTFEGISEAAAFAKTDDNYKVRAKPAVRRKKDDIQ
jgi:hypothetical protein|tara:strand:+ start:1437 stop:1610 length:174 start_codon:yes stop_codon:yes gene_type:complete